MRSMGVGVEWGRMWVFTVVCMGVFRRGPIEDLTDQRTRPIS